jgi:hypothetical protein
MTAKKQSVNSEPLLSAVARKLGHAAGALTKVTQQLTSNISSLPKDARLKIDEAFARRGKKPTGRSSSSIQPRKKVRKTTKTSTLPVAKRRAKSKSRPAKKH